jgi:hypothetical protein
VLYDDAPSKPRFSLFRLAGGLAILTGGGILLGDGLRSVVSRLGCGLLALRGGLGRVEGVVLIALYAAYVSAAVIVAVV